MTAKTSNTVKFVQPAAKRYARVLYELEIPKADIEKTKEIFCQVPEVYEVLLNPVITAKNKYSVIEQIFPKSILRAGSDEYDWSIRGRMNRLEQKLTWR